MQALPPRLLTSPYPAARYFSTDPAHLTLNAPFLLDSPSTRTITGQSTKAYGWADGTDDNFAKQDDQRYLRFTLDAPMTITISITATDPVHFLPAFSLYAGLGHGLADPTFPDFDGATITQQYLQSLGGTQPKAGAFDALHTFKIANAQAPNYDATNYAFTAAVSNVPEPSAAGLLAAGVAALGLLRQRFPGPRRALRT